MIKNSNKQFYWEDITVPNKRMKKVFNTTFNRESTNQSPNELLAHSCHSGCYQDKQMIMTDRDRVEKQEPNTLSRWACISVQTMWKIEWGFFR